MAGFGFGNRPLFGGRDDAPDQRFPAPPRPRPEYRRPLPPDQAETFTKALTDRGLSGLQYVASALDKPGRAVRGVLAGRNREALAAVPFSDSLGLTDPNDAVTGRDLLDKSGLTDRRDKGWGSWGAGVGAEMALDPLTYMTFGTNAALTKLGRAASNAGDLKNLTRLERIKGYAGVAPDLAAAGVDVERLGNQGHKLAGQPVLDAAARLGTQVKAGSPLAGHVGIGLPFQDPLVVLGTGKLGQRAAGLMDRGFDKLRYGNPVGRYLGAAFDPGAGDAVDAVTQKAMKRYGTPALQAAKAQGRAQNYGLLHAIDQGVKSGVPERDLLAAARETMERVPTNHVDPATLAAASPVGDMGHRIGAGQLASEQAVGLPTRDVADPFAAYGPRSAVNIKAHGLQTRGSNLFPTVTGTNRHREDLFREIPGGTEAINRWVSQYAAHPDPKTLGGIIRNDMDVTLRAIGTPVTPEFAAALDDKAAALGVKISGLSPDYAAHGTPFFTPDLAGDLARRSDKHARTMASAHAVHGAVGENARLMTDLGPDAVTVPELLDRLGLVSHGGDAAAGVASRGAVVEAWKKLARAGAGPLQGNLVHDLKALRQAASDYGLSGADAAAILRQYPKWAAPLTVSQPMKGIDSVTNAFKNMTYSVWPTSHVRNAASALSNNLMYGSGPASHGLAYKVMRDTATAAEVAAAHPGMPAGLTDQAARDWLRGQAYEHAKIFGAHNGATDLSGVSANALPGTRISKPVPGADRAGPTGSLIGDVANLGKEAVVGRKGETSPFDVLGQSGVAGRQADTWSPLAAGRVAGTNVEDYFRLANYLGNVKQGMHPAEAGRLVNKVHFDYDAVTPFEKNVMRRLVPFYTFQSRNLPLQLERMAQRPASLSAQLRPLGRNDPDQFTPDHIASGVAIPTGPEVGGNQQFVSQLGLPVEEAFERLKFKGGLPDARGTALSYLGGLNPLVKGPLEQLFNTQFHTGRKLSDLHAPRAASAVGSLFGDDNPQLLSQAVANTPLTRFVSTADRLLDERKNPLAKAANLLTGVRVTDVDMDKTRAIESRRALEELLSQSPNVDSYTNYYVRPDRADGLSADEVEQMRMLTLLQQNARAYAERQRAAGR